MEDKWKNYEVQGWGGFVVEEKLKMLRGDIKIWSKEKYGTIDSKIEVALKEFHNLDLMQEGRDLTEIEVQSIRKAKNLWLGN